MRFECIDFHFSISLKAHVFTQKTLLAALNFAQMENLKIKIVELFQNNNTSTQCLLGEHITYGPLMT